MSGNFIRNVLIKAAILFILVNLVFIPLYHPDKVGKSSAYNVVFPGRERFPFGESPQTAYNFSLSNLNAMFASHEINKPVDNSIYKVIILGDSSVWGTLLKPGETLAGQLNQAELTTCDGRSMRFYNLGYPTISLTKDLMILEQALTYHPDLVIWPMTLEAFPSHKQLASPLAASNKSRIKGLNDLYTLGFKPSELNNEQSLWEKTIIGKKRDLADLIRLQLYGVMWASTGIDQDYPSDYTPAAIDFEADHSFYEWSGPDLPGEALSFTILDAALEMTGDTPLLIINEPMLISEGENSELRYNFFYPRWAYDQYREELAEYTTENTIPFLDAWNSVPNTEYTNSAIHLTPAGEQILADSVSNFLVSKKWVCD